MAKHGCLQACFSCCGKCQSTFEVHTPAVHLAPYRPSESSYVLPIMPSMGVHKMVQLGPIDGKESLQLRAKQTARLLPYDVK